MGSIFKKGDAVVYVSNWDRKGSIRVRPCVVHSCGQKQMVLHDPVTGEEVGRHFLPGVEQMDLCLVVHADDYSEALALAQAEKIKAAETARFNRCLAQTDTSEGYSKAIRRLYDAMLATPITVRSWH